MRHDPAYGSFGYVLRWESRLHPGPGQPYLTGHCCLMLCFFTGGTLAFVSPSLAMHKTSSAVDRQREYLLDMIPPRSIPQSATWK